MFIRTVFVVVFLIQYGQTTSGWMKYRRKHYLSSHILPAPIEISSMTMKYYQYQPLSKHGISTCNPVKDNLVFAVRACNDAHVALLEKDTDDTNKLYEIVLGGWGNTRSCLRKGKQTTCLVNHQEKILHCDEALYFWVSWNKGIVKVGKGRVVGTDEILSYTDPSPIKIRYFAVSGGFGASADFYFCRNKKGSHAPEIIYLPSKYDYEPLGSHLLASHGRFNGFIFYVQACNDAHIALLSGADDSKPLYEIVIGGWGNTKSCLRDAKQGPCLVEHHESHIVSCHKFLPFWVTWKKIQGKLIIKVGKGTNIKYGKIMEYVDADPIDITNLAVSGWNTAKVTFIFCKQKGHY
ncbi:uncharacterized protein LOC133184808 [Saccostrea echinata]|uniref:uncharacterized protein LOC133184808 n=1 Tax=Saccostrea echinata TaxID=191078 RepID=UPI002A8325F8|nr:uncharacterized protein LOC133184808 [Saccostrea echinata]